MTRQAERHPGGNTCAEAAITIAALLTLLTALIRKATGQ